MVGSKKFWMEWNEKLHTHIHTHTHTHYVVFLTLSSPQVSCQWGYCLCYRALRMPFREQWMPILAVWQSRVYWPVPWDHFCWVLEWLCVVLWVWSVLGLVSESEKYKLITLQNLPNFLQTQLCNVIVFSVQEQCFPQLGSQTKNSGNLFPPKPEHNYGSDMKMLLSFTGKLCGLFPEYTLLGALIGALFYGLLAESITRVTRPQQPLQKQRLVGC